MIGASMAEILSAVPTSGGPYFWAYMLAPPGHAPFFAWITGWSDPSPCHPEDPHASSNKMQVQSSRPSRCHNCCRLLSCATHLYRGRGQEWVQSLTRENARHSRPHPPYPLRHQFSQHSPTSICHLQLNHFAKPRHILPRHYCPLESPEAKFAKGRLHNILRRYRRRWRRVGCPSV